MPGADRSILRVWRRSHSPTSVSAPNSRPSGGHCPASPRLALYAIDVAFHRGDLAEAAANLFAHLRAADRTSPAGIAVAPIPHTGLGEAINDRLRRAAG